MRAITRIVSLDAGKKERKEKNVQRHRERDEEQSDGVARSDKIFAHELLISFLAAVCDIITFYLSKNLKRILIIPSNHPL